MKSLQIVYSRVAIKVINSLDKSIKQRIRTGIEGLLEVPPKGDIKQMQGINPPVFRLRIGKYRVLYEYTNLNDEEVIMIKDIGSRGDIYK
ncbi:type II toxin-antitoxin system RelE/ParE family toxin [Desulfitobacterium sp.]|uniref:type II toxin-antitoxin system RelE family toxin n=1 Tax=Desulfitobacterium sp. TaxID=49981 RepID=UPI002C0E7FC9|nr:type II toxin-antitoxin system RelE/ParE family toxin [Desulfitobacterium sp.]HVJ50600.1 type II toxin-antitoxin system RelE/ParE family toxin [Desulfitobacterium sp.]